MGTFDSKESGLAESTNEESVVELDEIEMEPVHSPASRSGEAGADKLKQLLAKSRAMSVASDDYDDADDKTDMVTDLPELAGLEPLSGPAPRAPQAPQAPRPQAPPAASHVSQAAPQHHAPGPPAPAQPMMPDPSTSGIMYPPAPTGSFVGQMPPGFAPPAVPLAPSGEFGIVPDIGQSREDVPVYEPPSARRRRSIAVGATVVVGIIAFLVIVKLIIDQWVAPGRAVVWMTAGTTLPTLLCGLLLAWPNSEGRASLRDVLVALVPALALSGGAIFVASMWTQPAIRTLAVDFAASSPAGMAAILEDPSSEVAVAGCKRFAPFHEQTDYRSLLFAALTVRPKIATKCIAELPEDSQLALATSLSDRWSRELAVDDEDANQDRLCATAGGLASLPLERASIRSRLLACTLSSPSTKAQTCCGQSLAATAVDAKQWAKHLRESMEFAKDDETAAGVFAMAFHQKNLTEAQKSFAKEVNFTGPQVQLAALEVACDSIENGHTAVIRHMQASLEGNCDIDPSGVPVGLATWREVCFLTLTELESDRTLPPAKTMCSMARDVAAESAVETARRIVRLSRGKDLNGTFAKQIDLGYVKVLDEISATKTDGQDIPSFISDEDRLNAQSKVVVGDGRNSNYDDALPSDDAFQAFVKAYRANEPWKEAKKRVEKREAARNK